MNYYLEDVNNKGQLDDQVAAIVGMGGNAGEMAVAGNGDFGVFYAAFEPEGDVIEFGVMWFGNKGSRTRYRKTFQEIEGLMHNISRDEGLITNRGMFEGFTREYRQLVQGMKNGGRFLPRGFYSLDEEIARRLANWEKYLEEQGWPKQPKHKAA